MDGSSSKSAASTASDKPRRWFSRWFAAETASGSSESINESIDRLVTRIPENVSRAWIMSTVTTTEKEFHIVARGLVLYLLSTELVGGSTALALPSKAAESLWAIWKRYDFNGLERFCDEFLPNFWKLNGNVDASLRRDDSLTRMFVINCILDGISCESRRIPSLFYLDHQVSYPTGWYYAHITQPEDGVYRTTLDSNGSSTNLVWYIERGLSIAELRKPEVLEGLGRVGKLEVKDTETKDKISDFLGLVLCSVVGFEHDKLGSGVRVSA